ncbi:hypothetical protein WMF39_26440 [Sorangium sp. So ce1504]|uniref:hypothetical protein n=1 Tax=Sorangium sp. So ce1504 TaxID=3133337 RepID=UPI003F61FD42
MHGKRDKAVSAGAVVQRRYDEIGNLLSYADLRGATTRGASGGNRYYDDQGNYIGQRDKHNKHKKK